MGVGWLHWYLVVVYRYAMCVNEILSENFIAIFK